MTTMSSEEDRYIADTVYLETTFSYLHVRHVFVTKPAFSNIRFLFFILLQNNFSKLVKRYIYFISLD